MHYLLFIGAFLFFAFIAPVKTTLAVCLLLLLVTSVIRFTVHAVAGVRNSYAQTFKAVGLSFFFLAVAIFTLLSFAKGTGMTQFTGLAGHVVFFAFLASYVLGFKLSLDLTFSASAIVATVSTAVSTVLFLAFRSIA